VTLRQEQKAAELIGLILTHEASTGDIDVQREAQRVLDLIDLPEAEQQASVQRGEAMNFGEVVNQEMVNL
jgi:hypothetical protein